MHAKITRTAASILCCCARVCSFSVLVSSRDGEVTRECIEHPKSFLFFGVFLTSVLVSQKSFKTSLFTHFFSLFWTLSSYLTQSAFCNNTNNNKSTKERERERERDDGFFFFSFFLFVLSCARLPSRTTTR